MIYGWQLCFLYVSSSMIPQEDLYPVDAYPQKWVYSRDAMSYIREQIKIIKQDKETMDNLGLILRDIMIAKKKQNKLLLKRE